jgi:hypothetical protein
VSSAADKAIILKVGPTQTAQVLHCLQRLARAEFRVAALAGEGEVLVSGTVPPLVVGSGLDFADRGDHELRGVPGTWHLFAVKG